MTAPLPIVIPKPNNDDGRARLKVVVVTDVGFKGSGYVSFDEEEMLSLLNNGTPWLVYRTVPFRDGNVQYPEEVFCIKRDRIIAWAMAPLMMKPKVT